MPAASNPRRSPTEPATRPTFTVEHFGWGAPDRLLVEGTFSDLPAEPAADAVLTVFGEDGAHRLPAIDEEGKQQFDGGRLTASFAWLETPVAFQHARLELGDGLAVDLRTPEASVAGEPLPVEDFGPDDEEPSPAPEPTPSVADAESAADRLRLETRLLEQAEQLEDARLLARQGEEGLQRAQADLAAERERRATDAERFREGLAMVRRSAEEALEAAAGARAQAQEQARNEISTLRERIAELEPASAERDAAHAELGRAQEELGAVRDALSAARERAQELLEGLSDPAAGRR